jgi:prepilin-type N-terminal cleavage/methylation domain-containing protein
MSRGPSLQLNTRGFTIVELLIVVVVIAILAAITIVGYNGISNRAKQSAVQSSAASAAKKVISDSLLNSETYPNDISGLNLDTSSGATYQYAVNNTTTPKGFCLTVVKDGVSSYVAKTFTYNGSTVLDQSSPLLGACPGHSGTGGTLSTNLAPNPSFESNNTAGWVNSSTNITPSTTGATSGTYSVRVSNTNTSNTGDIRASGGGASSMPFGMEAGKTYTVSARVTYTTPATAGYNRSPGVLYWYSTNSSTYTEAFGPKAPTAPGTYTVSHTFTIPLNATGVVVGFGAAASVVNQSVYYDSIMVTEGSTVENFADGNTPGWVWRGAVNASISSGPTQ